MASTDDTGMLDLQDDDGIEHLWVAYSDDNGRTQGMSIPRYSFASTLEYGITFKANLGHN